jgi:FlaA1/EpsC-like NDP-sugar epimerase
VSRILITGGAGSIGPALIQELTSRGHECESFDLGANPFHDVRYPFDLEVKPDVVYHLAADKHAPDGEDHPYSTQHVNIEGTRNALATGCKVILASTCKAAVPETVYGASKMIAERMVLNSWGVVGRLYNVAESNRNVFQLWDAQYAETSRIQVTRCERYFITLDYACSFLADLLTVESGRYAPDPGPVHKMELVARKWCIDRGINPDTTIEHVSARRGDRIREPLCGFHETVISVADRGFKQILNPHDVHAKVPA